MPPADEVNQLKLELQQAKEQLRQKQQEIDKSKSLFSVFDQ